MTPPELQVPAKLGDLWEFGGFRSTIPPRSKREHGVGSQPSKRPRAPFELQVPAQLGDLWETESQWPPPINPAASLREASGCDPRRDPTRHGRRLGRHDPARLSQQGAALLSYSKFQCDLE